MARLPIALQMYTLRDLTAKDFAGTFREVSSMGYDGVEFAGTGGLSAKEMKTLLDDLNLRPAGSHIGLDVLEKDLNSAIDYNLAIGNPFIVCPFLPQERRADADGYRAIAELFNKIGAECKRQGIGFAYHNHAFEFEKFDGVYGLDLLYGNTDPELVKAEVDTYWVLYGGEDPAAFLRKMAGRCPLVHLKDMEAGTERDFAPVGTGVLPLNAIADAAPVAGAQWYIVEQDRCKLPPLESVRISINNLHANPKFA